MNQAHLLIIDDDINTLASLARAFRLAGHEAWICDNAAKGLDLLKEKSFDLVFSDVVMPSMDGITFLEKLREQGIQTPVVMISGQATVAMAVKATQLGALDFLEKPLSTDKLLLTVHNALRLTHLEKENRLLRQQVGKHEMVWESEEMRRVMRQVEKVADSEARVCIEGETGTGKELVARAIHNGSKRSGRPFVAVNCAAIPAELIESELFGHEKGSFTGAANRHQGKFEQAHRGTLFLDEIGDMPAVMQAKLLRVLEGGEIERIGGSKKIAVDARIVVATHRDLGALVRQGQFRPDLYHRVYVFPIQLPPLRQRKADVPCLARYFVAQIARLNNWKPKGLSPEVMDLLQNYTWPGNVRELRNVVERLMLLADDAIDLRTAQAALPQILAGPSSASPGQGPLAERVKAFERDTIRAELRAHEHRMAETARALGLERSHLYKKCQALGIEL
jgi:two-component system, NtrC family, nitrogen regulation response regulator NtrX